MIKKASKLTVDKYLILLGVISVLFLASVVRYSLRTYQFPQWDEQYYMHMASGYFRLLQAPSLSILNDIIQFVPGKQPGYPLLILPFLLLFGLANSYFWGLFTNGLLYVVTILGIYFIARHYLSNLASFLAAFIFAFYGWTLFHVHYTYSETVVSAICVLSILFLIKSNYFQNRKYSILFGLFFGFALLTRWVALIFVAGPLFYVFYRIWTDRLFKRKFIISNAVISFITAFIVAFYPYFINSYWVSQYFFGHRVGGAMWQMLPEAEKAQFSLYTLTFYLNIFNQLGTFSFILILAGLFFAVRKKSNLKPVLLAVLIPWTFLSFFSILKTDRFIIPIYPYLAILSASVFDHIGNIRIKTALIILTLILSLGTFLGTDWGKGPMKQSLRSISLPFSFGEVSKIYLTSISHPPYIYKITADEIIDYIEKDSRNPPAGGEKPQILSLFYYRSLDEPMMTHNQYEKAKPLNITNFLGTIITNPSKIDYELDTAFTSDYVLIKSGIRVDKSFTEENLKLLKAFIKLFENDVEIEKYYELKTKFWIYQDSSEVFVFKKIAEIPGEEIEKLKLKLIEYLKQGL